jgi:hypothetical protein
MMKTVRAIEQCRFTMFSPGMRKFRVYYTVRGLK